MVNYQRTKKHLLPYIAAMGFSFSYFFGKMIDFFSLITSGQNFNPLADGILTFIFQPISVLSAVYLIGHVFLPQRGRQILYFYIGVVLVHYIALFGFPSIMLHLEVSEIDSMVHASVRSVLLVTMILMLAFALVISFYFGTFVRKTAGKDEFSEHRRKAQYLMWGFLFFGIGATLNTVTVGFPLYIGRVFFFVSYLLIYSGFLPTKSEEVKTDLE